jgi:hypothetical protein
MYAQENQKAVFFGTPRPKKNYHNHKPQLQSKNTSGSEYTTLKDTPLAPKDSVFARQAKTVNENYKSNKYYKAILTIGEIKVADR